jgi:hypothetical protein
MITGHAETTPEGKAVVELHDGSRVILKAYLSEDWKKIRIVLPEFSSLIQPALRDHVHIIDFTRDVAEARRELRLASERKIGS